MERCFRCDFAGVNVEFGFVHVSPSILVVEDGGVGGQAKDRFHGGKCLFALWGDGEDFHDFVAEVVNDFDRDAAGGGFRERARDCAVEGFPGFLSISAFSVVFRDW